MSLNTVSEVAFAVLHLAPMAFLAVVGAAVTGLGFYQIARGRRLGLRAR
jgi:hypothetical protein